MTHPLTRLRDAELSLEELVQAASDLLAAAPEPADARVQPLPDARTIRYYQTSGLVDRPLRYAGREARYGYRHLLQVLAVKLLQRHGHRLARIQNALAGLTDDRLQSAVIDGLGTDPSPRPPLNPVRLPSDPAEGPRALVSALLAPGVVVTVDPTLVADPQALLDRLQRALKGASE